MAQIDGWFRLQFESLLLNKLCEILQDTKNKQTNKQTNKKTPNKTKQNKKTTPKPKKKKKKKSLDCPRDVTNPLHY